MKEVRQPKDQRILIAASGKLRLGEIVLRIRFTVEGIRHPVKEHIEKKRTNSVYIRMLADSPVIAGLQLQRGKALGVGNPVAQFRNVCNRNHRIEVKELDQLRGSRQRQNIARLYIKVKVSFVMYSADRVCRAFHSGNAVLDRQVSPVGQFLPLRVSGDNIQGIVCLKNVIGVGRQVRQAIRCEKFIAKLVGPPQLLLGF